ncbi:MAG: thiamine biosynthesis protein ThiS [Fusobacteriia bacterium 4572_132]|nr:MAG: thiamine biosynthesis protein ThiS [Fusobacteriia bacterium 4572_132]
MEIIVNGEKREIEKITIQEYIGKLKISQIGLIVEYNYKILKSEKWDEVELKDNDNLELINLVGGG